MGETTRITFRKMTSGDAEQVAALDMKCFGERDAWSREYFSLLSMFDETDFLVAESDGKIIACAGAEIFSDAAEILSFAVNPSFRRLGVGTKIFSELLTKLKERGAELIVLEVRLSNEAAIKFYESFGFNIVERAENYYLDEDAWIMAREI